MYKGTPYIVLGLT